MKWNRYPVLDQGQKKMKVSSLHQEFIIFMFLRPGTGKDTNISSYANQNIILCYVKIYYPLIIKPFLGSWYLSQCHHFKPLSQDF